MKFTLKQLIAIARNMFGDISEEMEQFLNRLAEIEYAIEQKKKEKIQARKDIREYGEELTKATINNIYH